MSDSASSFAKSKIYTKTGDAGTSSLYNGTRRPKTDPVFDALGHTDELNAHIGIAREYCIAEQNALDERLAEIQSRLMDVGSHVATPIKSSQTTKIERTAFSEAHVDRLENWIDQLDSELPPLKNFILPSGGFSSSYLHVCRAVTRRAERAVFDLVQGGDCEPVVGRYLNRLSDFFFVAARFASMKNNRPEIVYKKE